MGNVDFFNSKLVDDCYEFLHLIEMGKGTMDDLVLVFGNKKNLYESNYRQVERIKMRCLHAGVEVSFNQSTGKFETTPGSKFLFMEFIEELHLTHRSPVPMNSFGPFEAAKVNWRD